MKIYRVICTSIDIDEADNTVKVTTFFNKDKAVEYLKQLKEELKEQQKELDMEYYCVEENETSYERYLDGRAMEQSIAIWLEEDNTYDELALQVGQKNEEEKEEVYEI